MRNQKQRSVMLGHCICQQGQNLTVQLGVQLRSGFISDDQAWAAGNRLSNDNSLSLTAAELMQIRVNNSVYVLKANFY